MAQKKSKKTPASKISAATPEVQKDIQKKESLPESIAEDICEVIAENKAEFAREEKKKASEKQLGIRGIILVVTFAIFLYWGLHHLSAIGGAISTVIGLFSPFIIGFAIAFIINAVLCPLERLWGKLFSRTKGKAERIARALKRPVCLVLGTLIVLGVIFAVIFMIIPELKHTLTAFVDKFPTFISKLDTWLSELSEFLANYKIEIPKIQLNPDKILEVLSNFITNKGQLVLDKTFDITTSIFSMVFNLVLALVFAFYLLAQKEKIGRKMRKILYATIGEKSSDRIIKISSLANSTFTKFVTGQLTEAVIIGLMCFVGMIIFGMPYAPVISVLVGATALIPLFGAFIGTAIGAILILSVDFMTAVWFIVFIIILQQIESNLIYPRVVGKSVGLPGILVLAAVTLGGNLFGFVGILLSVPVCSVIYCVFNEFVSKRLDEKSRSACKRI